MAETKQIGKLENLITFKIDKTSFDAARKKIQQIKNEMKGISKPLQEALKPARAAQKMKPDYLVVQKQLNKVEKQQLKTAEALAKARNKQALAEQKIANQRRAQSVRGLTVKSGAGKASGTLFADTLRGEAKQDAASLRRQREINKAHTQAIIEDRKRSLNDQKQFNKMWDKEMNRIYNERRDDVLKRHNNARKERRARWKQEARDLKEMNRLHGQALAENMKRDQKIQNLYDRRRQAVLSARSSATAKRIARREREQLRSNRLQDTENKRNKNFDERAKATQDWFGHTFGRGGQRKATALYNQLRDKQINPSEYSMKLRTLRNDLYRAQRAQRSFNQSVHDMRGAFIQATASYTAFAGVMGIANVGKKFQGYQSAMNMAFGGKEEGQRQSQYAMSEIYRLGLDTTAGMDNYSKLAVAAKGKLKTSDLQNLFSGYSEYAKVAGASQDRISNGVVAMQQMLSKGRITAEEFRNQMAEQIVGSDIAFKKAVEEMIGRALEKGELEKMMSKGLLDPEQLFPLVGKYFSLLAKEGGALQEKLLQLETIETRMKTSFTQWMNATYSGGLAEGLSELYKTLDKMFFLMSQGDSKVGKFLKGFIDGARESLIWVHDTLLDIYYLITEDLGVKGVNAEMLGKASYYASIVLALNTITGLMKWLISAPLLNGLAALAGKILGVGAATEAVAAAQVTATAAVATASTGGWISLLISQSGLLMAALAPVAAVVAAIASSAAILYLAQSKYNDFSAEQKADWQQKMTTMNASATQGYYTKSGLEQLGSQGNLPNTNPYAQMMQASADTNRQLQETILNAPPLRVDVRVEESELSKFIKFRVEEGMQRQIQSIIPTGAPSLVVK